MDQPSTRVPVWLLVLLTAIIVAGASLRLAIALSDRLWLDELHTAWSTNSTFAEVAQRAAAGNQSPFYFWGVWCVRKFGLLFSSHESSLSLRIISWLAACGTIVAGCCLVWTWTRCTIATLCVALLMAVDTSLVFYSSEARPYGLMQFVALTQVRLYWRWLGRFFKSSQGSLPESPGNSWFGAALGLAVSTAILVSIHVTGFWLPLCEAVFFIAYSSSFQIRSSKSEDKSCFRSAWKSAILTALITVSLLVPGSFRFKQNFQDRENWEPISDRTQLLVELDNPLRWGILMPFIGMFLFNLSQSNRQGFNRTKSAEWARRQLRWQIGFVAAWGMVPVGGVWLIDFLGAAPMANARYCQVGMIAIPIFSALVICRLSKLWQQLTLMFFVSIGGLIINPWLIPMFSEKAIPQFRSEDWASTIHEINQGIEQHPYPILLFANLLEDRNALSRSSKEFQAFLKFPLYGNPQVAVEGERVIVYPTLDFQGLRNSDIETIQKQNGAWIIVRGRDPLVNEIVRNVFSRVKENPRDDSIPSSAWSIEFATFDQIPSNQVKLFLITKEMTTSKFSN